LYGEDQLIRTRFLMPRPKRSFIARDRLHALLADLVEFPVTEVIAGAGYGKSTVIAEFLTTRDWPILWYALSERDSDPQVFAIHLAHLFHRQFPGSADRALALLANPGGAVRHGAAAIEALADALLDHLDSDAVLVLDDGHLLSGHPDTLDLLNQLILHLPPFLHVVLASRQRLELPDLARWRLEGDVLSLDQGALSFDETEIDRLFKETYGRSLSESELRALAHLTEGWPMALPLFAQRWQPGTPLATDLTFSQRDLFDYLAREVTASLSEQDISFLLMTSVLSKLDPPLCAALTGVDQPDLVLRRLSDEGLPLIPLGDRQFRYHHLFREFLLAQLAAGGDPAAVHRAAADAWLAFGDPEEALEHLRLGSDLERANQLLAGLAPGMVARGQFGQLIAWAEHLPDPDWERYTGLVAAIGQAFRLSSRFDEAIAWFDRALARAPVPEARIPWLVGKAQVFLDTVHPAPAESLLTEALALTTQDAPRAHIQSLMAENRLNAGDLAGAARLLAAESATVASNLTTAARVHLRSGRLGEAMAMLRQGLADPCTATARAQREAPLVLAFLAAVTGEVAEATAMATQGLERAREQGARFTEGVAHIRLGHAHWLSGELEAAQGSYRQAIAIAESLGVERLEAEAYMGLALTNLERGNLQEALGNVRSGQEIAQASGDGWLSAVLTLVTGRILVQQSDAAAADRLATAEAGFAEAGDDFGRTLARAWRLELARRQGDRADIAARQRDLDALIQAHGYAFLRSKRTLLGPTPSGMAAPVFAEPPIDLDGPPTPALKIVTLGAFRVERDGVPLGDRAWGREKARQLLHLLVAYRGTMLPKARIIDLLWPDLDFQTADTTFRVVLNALNKALEPDRPAGRPTRFVLRDGLQYGLAMGPELWIDATEFERGLKEAEALESSGSDATGRYREALGLYGGDFLAAFTDYDQWCEQERTRLADRFSAAALRLARLLAGQGDTAGCLEWALKLIEQDRTSEEAYRLAMTAYYVTGDRPMALKTYERCVQALEAELDVPPMPATNELFERISALAPVTW
jgi:DNA-binding SARP family transcriptional activator